jgi:molybdate transport system substrate-binding protein
MAAIHNHQVCAMTTVRPLLAILFTLITPGTYADEVRVFAAGAAKHAVEAIAPAFQQGTGHTLRASYDTVGALRDKVLQAAPGEVADVVILSDAALATLRTAKRLDAAPAHSIGQVVVALAIPQNVALPDLSSPEALRQALLSAPSIAFADPARGATAGTHFAKVLDVLGITEAVKSKTTMLSFGVDVIRAVSEGKYALGVSQSSEIMQHPGIRFAGGLPAPHALSTGYSAALATDNAAAKQWLAFVASPQGMRAFASSGFVAAAQ